MAPPRGMITSVGFGELAREFIRVNAGKQSSFWRLRFNLRIFESHPQLGGFQRDRVR